MSYNKNRQHDNLKTPPSITGEEVSARWKRTYSGEVIMTVRMPHDTVDSEIYIKTPRGHSSIQMDPWMVSTWKRNWTTQYTPNRVTNDKLTRYKQEKSQRHISLHKTAGRHQMKSSRHWSPRPSSRHNLPANQPSVRQCHLNKVRYRNSSSMERPHKKRTLEEMSPAGSWSDPVIVASSGEQTESADEFQLDSLSPQSPPNHERGSQPTEYVPKSPVYPPPSDHSSGEESMPELESYSGQMTPGTEETQKIDHVNHMQVPADVNADKDHFKDGDRQDTLRQKLGKELGQAPWKENTSGQPLQ